MERPPAEGALPPRVPAQQPPHGVANTPDPDPDPDPVPQSPDFGPKPRCEQATCSIRFNPILIRIYPEFDDAICPEFRFSSAASWSAPRDPRSIPKTSIPSALPAQHPRGALPRGRIRPSSSTARWPHGHTSTHPHTHMATWPHIHMATWPHIHTATWTHGHMTSQPHDGTTGRPQGAGRGAQGAGAMRASRRGRSRHLQQITF